MTSHQDGMTIVEILLVVGILSILMALLLPAAFSSRESARRIQCLNNLRQLGLACHHHISAHRTFPYTSSSPGRIVGSEDDQFQLAASPHAIVMAWMDSTLSDQIDLTDKWLVDLSVPLKPFNVKNRNLSGVNVPFLRCPSDRYEPGSNNYRANMGIGLKYTFPDVSGPCSDDRNGRGAFRNAHAIPPSEFTDGLSNTVLFSEKVIGDYVRTEMSPFRDRFSWNDLPCSIDDVVSTCSRQAPENAAHQSFGGSNWLIGGLNATWYNHLLSPNSQVPDCSAGDVTAAGGGPGVYSARSFHSGGVNSVMADGSGRFVSNAIALVIWHALGTRNGEEFMPSF